MRLESMWRTAVVFSALLALTACEGVKKQFGMTKQSPDEFKVVARAPLTLPPEFTLRPPEPGAPRPQEGSASEQARNAIFRLEQPKPQPRQAATDGRSVGEASLLKAAGAESADPGIRVVVDQETKRLNAQSEDFMQALVFWRDEDPPGEIVDADAEARRLRTNAALGRTATTGTTPTIERREKALLEGIF